MHCLILRTPSGSIFLLQAGPVHPANPSTVRSESTKLSVDPLGEQLIYVSGRSVIIRSLATPHLATVYSQHTQPTTVARISPSGYYAASADVAGNVRVWDVKGGEAVLKLATRPLAGRINDVAWDGESKRLVVGGEGKDKFGAALFVDSGSSCGEIAGHAKPITALAVRHQRPFRAVSGSDDNSVVFHTAVPFKYDRMISTHTRFVRDVGFSPDGAVFASVGSDGKVFWYEGKTGDVVGSSGEGSSSLMALSWSPDSSKLATAGLDGVVTVWDAQTRQSAQTFALGSDLLSQQNGITYAGGNTLVSVSLSGVLNVIDVRAPASEIRYLYGPTKAITAAAYVAESQTFYAGSFDGAIRAFDAEGSAVDVEGQGHAARVAAIASAAGEAKVHAVGWDDKLTALDGARFGSERSATRAQPTGVAPAQAAVYVATTAGLEAHASGAAKVVVPEPTGAVAALGDVVAYGAGKKVVLAAGADVATQAEFDDNKGDVTALAFSPDGKWLAAGDAAGRIILIDVPEKKVAVSSRWTFHTGRITSLAFSADSARLASAGQDESIYVWDPARVGANKSIKNAHPGGVAAVAWKGAALVSAGADACVRNWTLET
ncbi:WD40 repeat-like protein [Cryptotrichosporon argae]